jgi:hypothetical protein
MHRAIRYIVFVCLFCCIAIGVKAQEQPISKTTPPVPADKSDTFFLAKKKGLLGRLGRSISLAPPGPAPVKVANPFLKFSGKTIRSIQYASLGFDRNIYDSNEINTNFGIRIAKAFHKNTKTSVIRRNLFFKEGDRVYPYLLADNEKHLRDLPYIQDARIIVELDPKSQDSVDIIVITKDVFSIGGSLNIGNINQGSAQLKEENFVGTGDQLQAIGLYDKARTPMYGYGGQFIDRDIKGSFIDWTTGFTTFNTAISGGGSEETQLYSRFDKPLVSAYFPWTGSLSAVYSKTNNGYAPRTSLYDSFYRYENYNLNAWFGYNFGSKKLLYQNFKIPIQKFIAIRALDQHFTMVPDTLSMINNFGYQNISGVLGAIDIFKQSIYRTNFIYGFGRNEDVPEGFSTSLLGGWIIREGRQRPYYGLDFLGSSFTKKESYYDYTFRIGGYWYNNHFEDADILFNMDHFTRLRKWGSNWYNRNFFTLGITKQINPVLNQPLLLQSGFGLPYFPNGMLAGDIRATAKGQCVFYELKKLLGFRFAPFAFADACSLTPTGLPIDKSEIYTAVGGGIRTRNENLIFGTFELKAFYFPRTMPGMASWLLQLNSDIQFTFSSTYIRQPDFILEN